MATTEISGKINPTRSRFTAKAFASGLLSSFGYDPSFSIRNVTGELQFVPDNPESANLKLNIRADSIEVTGDMSNKDRNEIEKTMREDVLEIDRFPDITFQSKSVAGDKIFENQYRVKIQGDLTLHGVTRPETIEAQVTVNGDQIRAYGDFTLRQTDYNIKLVSVAGGTLKLKDELKFSFDLAVQP
ncbi:YceI family protein [bacterium]|nr:YceI family protein [bacterium]